MPKSPIPDSRQSHADPAAPHFRRVSDREKGDEFNLSEVLANVWEGRYLILGSLLCFLALGALYAWTADPIYQVEGLLQTEANKTFGGQSSDFTKIEGAYALPTNAESEIEIIKSNLVLGKVVENLGLDLAAGPETKPILGKLFRGPMETRPAITVDSFLVPAQVRGTMFKLVALADGGFQLNDPKGTPLGQGRPGETLVVMYHDTPLSLKVRSLRGHPGQTFFLAKSPELDVINDLRLSLQAEERGKNTFASSNLLWLSLQAPDPERGAAILNEVFNQYIHQAVERKAGESASALALLEKQQPGLKAQVVEAEGRLNAYRSRRGAVDLAREGEIFLEQGSSLDAQISGLQQKKEELLRTYTEHSDLVTTVEQQIARLRNEARTVDAKVAILPQTQQDFIQLTRDAQVKSDMYTSLLNSIQQLQNTLAGAVGNARVVDYALPNYDAIAPKKKILMILFLFIGVVVGVGLTILRRVLRRGIEDHRILETKLGLPVLVTIPHSQAQRAQERNILKRAPGIHVMAANEPDDLSTESLRSLRTALYFAMEDTPRSILITGPSPKIGKSFVSTNLATVLCQSGARVLLVDADMRSGYLHSAFGLKRVGGLSEVLAGRLDWRSAVKPTTVPGLSLLSSGAIPTDPLVLLMGKRFQEVLAELLEAFDHVIFDAPPVLAVTDALVIGSQVDAVLLVAKYGAHPLDEMRACMNRLKPLGGRLKGCVFNDIKLVGTGTRYGYYKYDYAYKYQKASS